MGPLAMEQVKKSLKAIKECILNFEVHDDVHEKESKENLRDLRKAKKKNKKVNAAILIIGNEIAYISLSAEELKEYNYTKGDTEGLVNQALSINGIKMAAFFKKLVFLSVNSLCPKIKSVEKNTNKASNLRLNL